MYLEQEAAIPSVKCKNAHENQSKKHYITSKNQIIKQKYAIN